jgi:hypothetical protein
MTENTRAKVSSWIAVPTTVATRFNIFCVDVRSPRHVATIIAPGPKSIPHFKADVELMRLSPDIHNLLTEVEYLLSSYQAVANPQFVEIRRNVKDILLKLAAT